MKVYTPRPYQGIMVDHMATHKRCAVWAGMGLGKTVGTLTAGDVIELAGEPMWPALALGPKRVARKVWNEETQKWNHTANIHVAKVIGSASERAAALRTDAQIYTMNYENVQWLVEHLGKKPLPFRSIIADEARKLARFRLRQGGKMTEALGKIAWDPRIERFIELTGTPSPNGLKDLWGQLWFLDKGARLGMTYEAFDNRWFAYKRLRDAINPHRTHISTVILPHSDAEIHDRVKDLCLSIRAKDWFDIKEPIQVPVRVDMPPQAMKHYKEMERDFFTKILNHEIEAFAAGGKSMKLLQLAGGAAYVDPDDEGDTDRRYVVTHDEKIEALASVVEEAGGMPILVAVQFKSDIKRILAAFPEARLLDTEKDEDDFKAGLIPMLLAHPKSAGHGIDGFQNVTNIIVFFNHWWDMELRQQIIGRIGPERQMQAGFDRPVFVYDIIATGTIDEDVLLRHATKRSVQDLLLDAASRRG